MVNEVENVSLRLPSGRFQLHMEGCAYMYGVGIHMGTPYHTYAVDATQKCAAWVFHLTGCAWYYGQYLDGVHGRALCELWHQV